MPKSSTVSQLDETIRAKIAALKDKGHTLDEILAALEQLNVQVSRSALGRYTKNMDQVAERIRNSRALAEAVSREFGGKETSKVSMANIELMHSLLMKVMVEGENGDVDVRLAPMEAMLMAKALDHLAKASKTDFDKQLLAAKEQERRAATEQAAEKAVAAAKKQGLSAQTINDIKASILGIE